jgi:3-hydroxyisobutyrate dehydrogenase
VVTSAPAAAVATGARIGFVGLGRMGAPMAHRLVGAGYDLCGFDLAASPRSALDAVDGAASAARAADVAAGAQAVVLMLPDSRAVRHVLFDGGLLDALPAGAFLIDMGSSDPVQTRLLAAEAMRRRVHLLDAPVSGGVRGAEEGSLTVMVGAAEDVFLSCRPLLQVLGGQIRLVGPVGAGHALKALNNLLSAASMLATAETMSIGMRFGLELDEMLATINSSSGRSWSTEYKFPRFVSTASYASGFGLQLLLKDVRIALDLARATGAPAQLAERVEEQWAHAAAALPPDADHTHIARWVEEQ